METVSALDAESLEQPVVDHSLRAAETFLGGLKYQSQRAGEFVAAIRNKRCCTKQNCDVAVVTAGVHGAVGLRTIRVIALLKDRERIHIGSQHDRSTGSRRA